MLRLRAIPLLAALFLNPYLHAQMRGPGMAGPPGASFSPPRTFTPAPAAAKPGIVGLPAVDRGREFHGHGLLLPFFYSDYPQIEYVQPEPQVVTVQPPPPAPEPIHSEAPLLIEWQGDHYVRVSGDDRRTVSVSEDFTSPPPRELLPATLVFRDGSRREVSSYTIVDGVLYADSNYWDNGQWAQPIRLSLLDVQATVESNRQKGVRFVLPGGPNQVVVRP